MSFLATLADSVSSVGPQDVKGERTPLYLGDRCLPVFQGGRNDAEARGYVRGNYLGGLGPAEMFFHLAAGRYG